MKKQALTGDPKETIAKAKEIAKLNTVAGKGIELADSDFVFGQSQRSSATGRYKFTAGVSPSNSMRVSIKRLNSSANGGIDALIPGPFGKAGFEFEKSSVSTRVDVDIALVLDRSGSMIYASNEAATGFPPKSNPTWKPGDPAPPKSRWLDLAAGANAFLQEMELSALDEFVSLVTYASDVTLDRSVSNSYSQVNDGIGIYTKKFTTGATNIGGGLQSGLNSLGTGAARASASNVIILIALPRFYWCKSKNGSFGYRSYVTHGISRVRIKNHASFVKEKNKALRRCYHGRDGYFDGHSHHGDIRMF